jgi:hypothetical protein
VRLPMQELAMPDLDLMKQEEQGYALVVGPFACQIDAGELIRHANRETERAAAVEQRGEFDETAALASLARPAPAADGKTGEPSAPPGRAGAAMSEIRNRGRKPNLP